MDRVNDYREIKIIELGDYIRSLRVMRGMSSLELAKKAHLSQTTVLRMENGLIQNIRVQTLLKLAKVLKFDYREYMDLTKNRRRY